MGATRLLAVASSPWLVRFEAIPTVLRLEELRIRQGNMSRALDLEDGSASINAKLGNVEAA